MNGASLIMDIFRYADSTSINRYLVLSDIETLVLTVRNFLAIFWLLSKLYESSLKIMQDILDKPKSLSFIYISGC